MKRKRLIQFGFLFVLLALWLVSNRPGRFGWACYAFTVYNAVPRPISDLQIRANGRVRKIAKTHNLEMNHLDWLLEDKPDVLIISIGWDGVVETAEGVKQLPGTEIHILKNEEAKALFNSLKKAGRRVAIHYHSTC